jgi:hypothetical protein
VNAYPRTWVLRHGPDAGKVLIAFSAVGPALLVGADGSVSEQWRVPPAEVRRVLPVADVDGAA